MKNGLGFSQRSLDGDSDRHKEALAWLGLFAANGSVAHSGLPIAELEPKSLHRIPTPEWDTEEPINGTHNRATMAQQPPILLRSLQRVDVSAPDDLPKAPYPHLSRDVCTFGLLFI